MTPVNNDLLDYVSGWFVRVRVQVERVSLCEVPMDGITPGDFTCADAVYNIYDTDGTLLYTGVVASGGTLDQTIADSTAVLKDTANNTISTTSILAEGSEDIVAPDAVINFQYEDKSPIGTVNYLSGSNQNLLLPDNTVENSDQSYQDSAPYGSKIILPDTTYDVYVNGVFNQSVNLVTLKNETLNINA